MPLPRKDLAWTASAPITTPQRVQPWPQARVAALLILVPVLLAGLVVVMVQQVTQLHHEVAPRPACTPAAAWLPTIIRQEQQGAWAVAAANAATALTTPALCVHDRTALATKDVADGLEALYGAAYDPRDVTAEQREVTAYHSLQQQARAAGVPFPSSLQVSQRAYQIGQFYLSKAAFEDAYQAGAVTTANQALVQLYDSALYNLGYWWVQLGTPTVKQQGLRFLATSAQIDTCFQVGSGAAAAELHRQLGHHAWPVAAVSPLLVRCKEQTSIPRPKHVRIAPRRRGG